MHNWDPNPDIKKSVPTTTIVLTIPTSSLPMLAQIAGRESRDSGNMALWRQFCVKLVTQMGGDL